ncbi:hypothetical protein O9K51_11377 [Purpureocillium lavendulum]|uniref:Cerato-platanin n=1 Tax=Purpureocillium lavendulum TaxID=1247861 RepID=A0AB34FAI0_9HYPO|nr:hypothetical protein O9K51_11377 [Purpureocillium lavendulum]
MSSMLYAANAATGPYNSVRDSSRAANFGVACSDGSHGLQQHGYLTLGSVPNFPMIGSAHAISGWNSANCGTCWRLTYEGNSVTVLAIDHCTSGFDLSFQAMNNLTDGRALELGRINADAVQISASECGM